MKKDKEGEKEWREMRGEKQEMRSRQDGEEQDDCKGSGHKEMMYKQQNEAFSWQLVNGMN